MFYSLGLAVSRPDTRVSGTWPSACDNMNSGAVSLMFDSFYHEVYKACSGI